MSEVVEILRSMAADLRAIADARRAESSPLLTREQVAELFQVDQRTLRRWELERVIPEAIHVGGVKRWRRSQLLALIEGRRK